MKMTRPPLEELIARADELADKFENYEPKPEDFDAPLPPLMAVKLAAFKRAHAERELAEAIAAAREADISWRALGEAVGTSGEAARQRYGAGREVSIKPVSGNERSVKPSRARSVITGNFTAKSAAAKSKNAKKRPAPPRG